MSSDDDLLERALDGLLDEREEEALAARLRQEAPLARRLMELSRDEALFHDWASSARAFEQETRTAARRPGRKALWAGAAAALAAAALLISLLPRSDGAAEVVEITGTVTVRPGEEVHTGEDGRALLRYPDGTTLRLHPRTSLHLGTADPSRRVRLASGTLTANVTPLAPGRTFLFLTPDAEAQVVGTRFDLAADPAGTKLTVEEGKVLISKPDGGTSVPVAAGQFAIARRGVELAALPVAGTGLRGEYFDNDDLTHLKLTRIDPTIEMRWAAASPHPLLDPESFSVRWTGKVMPRFTETYTFHALTDDGVRLWIDGRPILDSWEQSTLSEKTGSISLTAWQPAEIRLEYFDRGGPATCVLAWSSPRTPRQAIPREALFAPPLGGTGLKGEYFDTEAFTNLKLTRIDPLVDYDWGTSAPHPSMETDYFSVRWTGVVVPRFSERYTFHTESDDGVRLWVDGKAVIDDWKVRGTQERSGVLMLEAGRRAAIRLEYFDCVSTSRVKLLWTSPSQPREVIPQDRLFPEP